MPSTGTAVDAFKPYGGIRIGDDVVLHRGRAAEPHPRGVRGVSPVPSALPV